MIESDNCTSQYKSAQHYHDLQEISTKYDRMLVRVFGIAGDGKGEIDHIGVLAKIAIRQVVTLGKYFNSSKEILEFLSKKFNGSKSLSYMWKEIEVSQLHEARAARKLKVFETIYGSSKFHCMVFKPNGNSSKASPRICLCDDCSSDYGSCSSFKVYPLICHQLKRVSKICS